MTTPHGFALYASVGDELIRYEIDVKNAQLTRRESIQLPGNVQYLWPEVLHIAGQLNRFTSSELGVFDIDFVANEFISNACIKRKAMRGGHRGSP